MTKWILKRIALFAATVLVVMVLVFTVTTLAEYNYPSVYQMLVCR